MAGRLVRERRKLTGIRKTSARRVQEAWQIIPHIVQMVDVDATALLATRSRLKAAVPSLTLNDLILQAAAHVMAELPELNGTVEGDTLVFYQGVDVGFAVDTPRGLIVPVIRRADNLSVEELAAESQRLIEAARSGRLGPENIGGASLTVSNLGMFGIRAGTPVISGITVVHGQLPMSLFDDATIRSTLARPMVLTVAWTAFTVRPLSGVLNGSCSLRTSLTTPTLIVVLGATCVGTAITTVDPTAR